MKNVYIVGAGQLGSRHLQSLKLVSEPLRIFVIDPNMESLNVAKERFDAIPEGAFQHSVQYCQGYENLNKKIDLAIVATNSNNRRSAIENLLCNSEVESLILEKILFSQVEDYDYIKKLLEKSGSKAWVNCCMRVMPFYQKIKEDFIGSEILYQVTGSQYGLITNVIHYLDHMAFLTNSLEYSIDTNYLEIEPIQSKRRGFLELNGTITAKFKNNSVGSFTCFSGGNSPTIVQISNHDTRFIVRESEGKAWVSKNSSSWAWSEIDSKIPYQSEMTKNLVQDIFSLGSCALTSYNDSMKIHMPLVKGLMKFLNEHGDKKYEIFPFT